MKAVLVRQDLLNAFQHAASVIPARSPKPVLRCARLDFKDLRCLLSATDLDIGLRYVIDLNQPISEPTAILLPVSETLEILREMTDDNVELELGEKLIRLAGLTSEFELPIEDPQEFPEIPEVDEVGHRVKAGILNTMIRRVIFAAASENTRYALHSVLIEFDEPDLVRMVATDGRRLAMQEGQAQKVVKKQREGDTLLSPKALSIIQKVPMDPEEELEMVLRANDAQIRSSKITIYSRLVEGRYPRYLDVFPPESKIRAVALASRLAAGLRQAKIITTAESRGVDFRFEDNQLVLKSQGKDAGRSEVRVPIATIRKP